MLTGESRPVTKGVGDQVAAGTLNSHGMLRVKVTGTLKESALGRIIRLVEDAQASKAPIQCMADRIVPWFVSITIMLTTLTFIWWIQEDFAKALMAATAVLIITCPCAFGMATPMSIAVASGLGARYGVLVKNGEVLETLSDIGHLVFDKTGTLTEGKMTPTVIRSDHYSWQDGEELDESRAAELLADAITLERYSEHPIGRALVEFADQREWPGASHKIEGFEYRPGFGVAGQIAGRQVAVGTSNWMEQLTCERDGSLEQQADELSRQGITPLFYAREGRVIALIGVEDRIRDGASELLRDLRAMGMRLTLLSGDRRQVAEAIAQRLGGMEVIAEVLPEEKDRVIVRLQSEGGKVAMVGDGVNDAPALVRADVGIAMGGGTDVSIASADVVLMSGELDKVRLGIALSARTLRTIRQNIGISITYNIIMVPLAMAALITPLVAAVSMPISSLAVIANAARIRTLFKGEKRHANY
jgi:Cu2+-exporting ATPase